ncbi:MAG: hypothetical protein OEQ53_16740 [Saprospiraceae bacterium]|nr:hypothetical protein [Saprospiraceae bacterium]
MKNCIFLLVLFCIIVSADAQVTKKLDVIAIADVLEPQSLSGPSIFDDFMDLPAAVPMSYEGLEFEGLQAQSIVGSKLESILSYSAKLHLNKFIILNYKGDQMATCHISDLQGEIVFRYPLPLSAENTYMNMDHLIPGDYYLYIYSAGQLYREKFTKE